MYWLLSILILVIMMATLAITGNTVLPSTLLSVDLINISIWPYLILIVIALLFSKQRSTLLAPKMTTILLPHNASSTLSLLSRTAHYLLMTLLATTLIIGSALQALSSYQRAENTKIMTSMRVQALVTIEGISDSVYDLSTDSGYRQVATITHIAPLTANLSAQDLDVAALNQLMASNEDNSQITKYQILLSAYPKNTLKANSKASKDSSNFEVLNGLQPGDQVLMSLALAPLASSQEALNNPTGFDSYRWLRGRHIDGVANILAVGTPIQGADSNALIVSTGDISYLKRLRTYIDQGRWQLRQSFYRQWPSLTEAQQQANAVTLSLLTGDRSLINRETKDLYQLAGISHLLAISGTHVLFLAIVLSGLATLIVDRFSPVLYRHMPRWQVRWSVMISAAFIYALFTGFDVPAARTAWMLMAVGTVRLTLLPISTTRVLLALAVLMAWVDPFVLWQAGYWLSFVAVALLLRYEDSLQRSGSNSGINSQQVPASRLSVQKSGLAYVFAALWPSVTRLFKLQCWLFIALLPITLLLFGKASLWGLVINLFAIGLFGWIIVPLNLLAGLCYLLMPSVATALWALVSGIVTSLHELITWLTALPALKGAWVYTSVNPAILLMALLTMLPWLLPRGLLSRWLALAPLSLLIMTVYANQQTLILSPTLYVLPTNDRYISAAVLQYPINKSKDFDKNRQQSSDSVSWLFLADHRPKGARTMASSLSADKLSATLEQQLRTLSIRRLEGMVVQTNVTSSKDKPNASDQNISSGLLEATARQLSQNIPTKQYWQAGKNVSTNTLNEPKALISSQECIASKSWRAPNGELSIEAITGWSSINDSSVWDCSLAIESETPIRVLQYNAADPMRSQPIIGQALANATAVTPNTASSEAAMPSRSRLVLDVATHKRLWQLWLLLCPTPNKLAASNDSYTADNSKAIKDKAKQATTWLSHSTSAVPSKVLAAQHVEQVLSYDDKALDAAFALNNETDAPK